MCKVEIHTYMSDSDYFFVVGDFNGHVGQQPGVHGGHGVVEVLKFK